MFQIRSFFFSCRCSAKRNGFSGTGGVLNLDQSQIEVRSEKKRGVWVWVLWVWVSTASVSASSLVYIYIPILNPPLPLRPPRTCALALTHMKRQNMDELRVEKWRRLLNSSKGL
jgi:hypothetical protein